MAEINIDGKDCILGRICTYAAKQALIGKKVNILNCEKIMISGDPKITKAKYKHTLSEKGQPHKGPYVPKMPDRFVRKVVKRMLPHTTARGKEALKRTMCYMGIPSKFKDTKLEKIQKASTEKLPSLKKCSVLDVCRHLGGKI